MSAKELIQVSRAGNGRGPIYRSRDAERGFADRPDINSLFESFAQAVAEHSERQCLGWRSPSRGTYAPFEWLTYAETLRRVEWVAAGLHTLSLNHSERIGLYGINCKELMIAIQACSRSNYVCVPLYDSLGEQAVQHIIKHANTRVVISAAEKLSPLVAAIRASPNVVKAVIYWGEPSPDVEKDLRELGLVCMDFDGLMKLGAQKPVPPSTASRRALCTIMYTSGSTGMPKGVMLTHGAILACVAAQLHSFVTKTKKYGAEFTPDNVVLSFLPLAHIMDRVIEEAFLAHGCSIGYWRGDIRGLANDIEMLRPTFFVGVPRVFDRVRDAVLLTVAKKGPVSRAIFNWALDFKLTQLQAGHLWAQASPFTDWLVWRKVAARLGGKVQLVASGSAPLAPATRDFLRVAMCAPVIEGYGLTETCGSSFTAEPLTTGTGSVGHPLACLEFSLGAVPEMGCDPLARPPRGEILIRGPVLFSGYYKDEATTGEVIDYEGFFHTGDIGELDPYGQLHIVDRKKSLFKLSQGEYVSPELVESVIITAPAIEQVFVTGKSSKNSPVAIVVPCPDNPDVKRIGRGDLAAFCHSTEGRNLIQAQVEAASADARLKPFQWVRSVKLEKQPFTVENGLITPTFKLKRPALRQLYEHDVDRMYDEMDYKDKQARASA